MAVEMPVLVKTFEASGDLSTKQFYFMKQDTTVNRVTTCTATTDIPIFQFSGIDGWSLDLLPTPLFSQE